MLSGIIELFISICSTSLDIETFFSRSNFSASQWSRPFSPIEVIKKQVEAAYIAAQPNLDNYLSNPKENVLQCVNSLFHDAFQDVLQQRDEDTGLRMKI